MPPTHGLSPLQLFPHVTIVTTCGLPTHLPLQRILPCSISSLVVWPLIVLLPHSISSILPHNMAPDHPSSLLASLLWPTFRLPLLIHLWFSFSISSAPLCALIIAIITLYHHDPPYTTMLPNLRPSTTTILSSLRWPSSPPCGGIPPSDP